MQSSRSGNWIFAIPSFWGLATWSVALSAYLFGGIGWEPVNEIALSLLLMMPACFLFSLLIFSPVVRSVFNHRYDRLFPKVKLRWEFLLHGLGVVSSLMVIYSVTHSGWIDGDFFTTMINDPIAIRTATSKNPPVGIYIGYAGWIGAFISGAQAGMYKKGRWVHYLLLAIQVVASLVFLSKIRPIAIILLFAFPYLILNYRRFSLARLVTLCATLIVVIVGFFLVWSDSTGKVYALDLGYPPAVETFLLYLTSGPAYFSHIVAVEVPDMDLSRTLRPFYMLSAMLFDTAPPPPSIIPFYSIPITTNVGTTLEPWFRDYGIAGVLVGVFVVSFGVDLIAYWGLKFGRISGTMVAVVMCFCSTLAFFVPRLTSGAVMGALLIFFLHFFTVMIRQLAAPKRQTMPLSPQTS